MLCCRRVPSGISPVTTNYIQSSWCQFIINCNKNSQTWFWKSNIFNSRIGLKLRFHDSICQCILGEDPRTPLPWSCLHPLAFFPKRVGGRGGGSGVVAAWDKNSCHTTLKQCLRGTHANPQSQFSEQFSSWWRTTHYLRCTDLSNHYLNICC